MKLTAITPPYFYTGEARAIERVLRRPEYERVYVRKPGCTAARLAALIEGIDPCLRQYIAIGDHLELASDLGVGAVHLSGRSPLPPPGWSGAIGRSCHSSEELRQHIDSADYLFISPIFPSLSKPGYGVGSTLAADPALQALLVGDAGEKIVALGGVEPARYDNLRQAGFRRAAMLTAAWRPEMSAANFRLQLITHPMAGFDPVEQTRRALEGGCRWVQLRGKNLSDSLLVDYGRRMAELCRGAGATLIVDDRVDLVETIGADGVHLGQKDMPVDQARRILGPGVIIGATANTPQQIARAGSLGADYVGYGPFRFTTTKENLSPVLGLEGYRDAVAFCRRNGIDMPIVAIGGIEPADVASIMAAGVAGIAVSRTIVKAADPTAATADLVAILEKKK